MPVLAGSAVVSDPRFDADVHFRCPVHEEQAPWTRAMLEGWFWSRSGRSIRDWEPDPSAALIEAMLLLDTEFGHFEAERARIERAKTGAGHGS